MSTEKIELDNDQREKAEQLLDQLSKGEIQQPGDVLEDWKSLQEIVDYSKVGLVNNGEAGEDHSRKKRCIPVSDIAGTSREGIKIMEHRFENVLNWLLSGEFKVRHSEVPILEKFDGEYYVSTDGHHRVVVFKVLDIEEMYVEYVEVEIL